jgi:hypothetical protein
LVKFLRDGIKEGRWTHVTRIRSLIVSLSIVAVLVVTAAPALAYPWK